MLQRMQAEHYETFIKNQQAMKQDEVRSSRKTQINASIHRD